MPLRHVEASCAPRRQRHEAGGGGWGSSACVPDEVALPPAEGSYASCSLGGSAARLPPCLDEGGREGVREDT